MKKTHTKQSKMSILRKMPNKSPTRSRQYPDNHLQSTLKHVVNTESKELPSSVIEKHDTLQDNNKKREAIIATPFDMFVQYSEKNGVTSGYSRMEWRKMYKSLPDASGDCTKPNCKQYFVRELFKNMSKMHNDSNSKQVDKNITHLTSKFVGFTIESDYYPVTRRRKKDNQKLENKTMATPKYTIHSVPVEQTNNITTNNSNTISSNTFTDITVDSNANKTINNNTVSNKSITNNNTVNNNDNKTASNNTNNHNTIQDRIANINQSIMHIAPCIITTRTPLIVCNSKQVKNTLVDSSNILYSIVLSNLVCNHNLVKLQVQYKDEKGNVYTGMDQITKYMYQQCHQIKSVSTESKHNIFINIKGIAYLVDNVIPPHVELGYHVCERSTIRKHIFDYIMPYLSNKNALNTRKWESLVQLRDMFKNQLIVFSTRKHQIDADTCRIYCTITGVNYDNQERLYLVVCYKDKFYEGIGRAVHDMKRDYFYIMKQVEGPSLNQKIVFEQEEAIKANPMQYLHLHYCEIYHALDTIITPDILSGKIPYNKNEPCNPLVFTKYKVQYENRHKTHEQIIQENIQRKQNQYKYAICLHCKFPCYKTKEWYCETCFEECKRQEPQVVVIE
jgi:hypothetical protein